MNNKIVVPEYARVKVYWDDKPENYSRQAKLDVRNYFSKKYGVSKDTINVVYRPVKIGKNGEVIEISGAGIENILDRNYQLELMKEWFKREGKTIDFKRITDLDKKVNDALDNQSEIVNNRSWILKWMYIDNFLCFGEKNFVSLGALNGLNIITSEPANQGGKTTFSVDAIKFLLFGRTTKTEKNEQIFNTYTDKDALVVRGMLEIEGQETIIERKLSRTAKKSGGWNVTNKVNYYKILPDGEEVLLNDEDSKKTSEVIKNNIGEEKDFDTTILATARNLEDLVDAKPTESGRLLTKFIGLEVIENKEIIAKQMNSEFNKIKKGNHYNVASLLADNITNEENVVLYNTDLKNHKENLSSSEKTIVRLDGEKERLLNSKLKVDVEISQLNPEGIQKDINGITARGLEFKTRIEEYKLKIKEIESVSYDEYLYDELENKSRVLTIEIGALNSDIAQFGKVIADLRDNEICQACKRPLDDVDNTETIEGYETKIHETKQTIESKTNVLTKINDSITKMKGDRETVDRRNRLELEKDKAEVEIDSLRNKMVTKKADLKKYKANEDAIKTNINIDADISAVKTDLIIENKKKDDNNQEIYTTETTINTTEQQIVTNDKMIKTLKKEEEIVKVFKIYLEMVGKKGISKLVLRSVLPIINSELHRLLDEVCNFEIELVINSRNEVEYNLIKSDVVKGLKSGSGLERTIASLALRCVLGKISHLPTPNFITFDEVLGKVAAVNIEGLKPMFDKIKDMFDIVFFISHNDLVRDWGDNIITIKKINDVSSINL
tara:strand:- start:21832 stop:24180 length:2349 start_codon:yes stop_codon:yes gene_type:complete